MDVCSDSESYDSDQEAWNDEIIDEEIRQLISVKENGKIFSIDTVAHMEYFYNTLQCSHKTVNPFDCFNSAQLFPALYCNLNDKNAEKTGATSLFQ